MEFPAWPNRPRPQDVPNRLPVCIRRQLQDFRKTGFRPGNAWYLNDTANIRFVSNAPNGGNLGQPVLFVNGQWDSIGDIAQSHIGEPMRRSCSDLTISNVPSGHWLPLERKTELTDAIRSWANLNSTTSPSLCTATTFTFQRFESHFPSSKLCSFAYYWTLARP